MGTETALTLQEFVSSKQHFTQPPAHYTEAALVKTLEELGNRAAQHLCAHDITTILARRYVVKENKNLYLTELGEVVNNMMKQAFPSIVETDFTGQYGRASGPGGGRDGQLEDGGGELSIRIWKSAVEAAEKELKEVKVEDEVTDVICEECGRHMVIKYGPHGRFLACPGFPECRNTKPYLEKIGVLLSQVRQGCGPAEDEKGPEVLRLREQSGM